MSAGTLITGTFSASGNSATYVPLIVPKNDNSGAFRVWLDFSTGSGAGTVKLQSQPSDSDVWYDDALGIYSFTAGGFFDFQEHAEGTKYRLNCVHTSGSIAYRIGY